MCGAISYEVTGPLRPVVNCHCDRCRRATGHFMAASAARRADVAIVGDVTWYDATDEVQYGFCGTCGSTLFWRTSARPDTMSIAAGTLDPPTGLTTVEALFGDRASDYHTLDTTIPTHPGDWPTP